MKPIYIIIGLGVIYLISKGFTNIVNLQAQTIKPIESLEGGFIWIAILITLIIIFSKEKK